VTSVFVKICGTTSEEDALLAVAMGADAVGFVFAPSPRQVGAGLVADIVKRLPPDVLTVGVFRDETPGRIVKVVRETGLRAAQFHGAFTVDDARAIRKALHYSIPAFAAGDPRAATADEYEPWAILLDSPHPGSGTLFDWALAAETPDGLRQIVAGGLTPENVGDAVRVTKPWGVDVVTGVEKAPGHKDAVKLRAFVAAARGAAAELEMDDDRPPDSGRDVYDWMEDGV
jgi:phosphoribosylanthranilate isomerase